MTIPEHILTAIYEIMRQHEKGVFSVSNFYKSVVSGEGNEKALKLVDKYFETCDDYWRGIGRIGNSALKIKEEYSIFDAGSCFDSFVEEKIQGCRCTDVILGRIVPYDCPLFGTACTPMSAVGPCMVSAEGACGIWFKNRGEHCEN